MYQYRMLEKWEMEHLKRQMMDRKKIGDGSEGIVLLDPRDSSQLMKLHYHPTIEQEFRLQELCDRDVFLQYSTLPYGGIYYEYDFLGSYMKYFSGYIPLLAFKYARTISEVKEKIELSQYMYRNILELYQNDIYLMDLDLDNLLVHPTTKDLQVIDFDSQDVSLDASSQKLFLKRFLETLLDLYFMEYPFCNLEEMGFSADLVRQFHMETLSLDFILEWMDKVEKDNLILKQLIRTKGER